MTEEELTQTIEVLRKEVEILTLGTRLEPHAIGYIPFHKRHASFHAVEVMNGRIDELMQEAQDRQ